MHICIVGGGSAGWMSASTFVKVFPKFKVTLIESPNVKTVGVGESTIRPIQEWINLLELNEKKFLRETDGVFKHSIKFTNFLEKILEVFIIHLEKHLDQIVIFGQNTKIRIQMYHYQIMRNQSIL